MTAQPFPRGRTRVYQVTEDVEPRPVAPTERHWSSRFCDSLGTGANKLWSRTPTQFKRVILIMIICGSMLSLIIGFIFLGISLMKVDELRSLETRFEELLGYDLPCYAGSTQWCSLYMEDYKSGCLESCQLNRNCFTAVYNSRDASCKLYYENTPYMMLLQPYPEEEVSIFIKKIALFHRLYREEDNLFYFVSEAPLSKDQAQAYCYDAYEYAHVALLPFVREEQGKKVAMTVAREAAAKMNVEVDLLLHIVAGGPEMIGDTHASIARRVDTHLQFQGSKPRNSQLLAIIITSEGALQTADFFTRYYILCQHDPFNIYRLADFFFNLNPKIRTGQRRRKRELFRYEDF